MSRLPQWRVRFSLCSLVLAVWLIGSGLGLWWHWSPWQPLWTVAVPGGVGRFCGFLSDGKRLLTLTEPENEGPTLHLWDADRGVELRFVRIPVPKTRLTTITQARHATGCEGLEQDAFYSYCWVPKSVSDRYATVVIGLWRDHRWPANTVELRTWDAATGDLIVEDTGPPVEAAFLGQSPDGETLLVGESARLRLVRTADLTSRAVIPWEGSLGWPKWSPDGSWFAATVWHTGPDLFCVRVFDAATGARKCDLTFPAGVGVSGLFALDSRHLVIWACGPTNEQPEAPLESLIYDVERQEILERLPGVVSDAKRVPGGTRLILSDLEGDWVYDLETKKRLSRLHLGIRDSPFSRVGSDARVLLASNGLRVIMDGMYDHWTDGPGQARVFDATTGECLLDAGLAYLKVSTDGQRVAWKADHKVSIFNTALKKLTGEFCPAGELEEANDFVFSADGTRMVMKWNDDRLGLWALCRPEPLWGLVVLPELWLCVVFGSLLVWSLWRDKQILATRR